MASVATGKPAMVFPLRPPTAPIFPPLSKPAEREPLGVGALAAAASADVGGTVIAQGGIEVDHVEAVIAAGAGGVAVTGAVLAARDCGEAARALRGALDRAARR